MRKDFRSCKTDQEPFYYSPQKAFDYLYASPRTMPAKEHRPDYGIDGKYFSKPNVELIFETVWEMMHDNDVNGFSELF